jgi:hypothetical protein
VQRAIALSEPASNTIHSVWAKLTITMMAINASILQVSFTSDQFVLAIKLAFVKMSRPAVHK